MPGIEKQWNVMSSNPRPSHAAMDGETAAIGEPFSNGLMYPGDSANGDVSEIAGCTCVMTLGGQTATAFGSMLDMSSADRSIVRAYVKDGGASGGAGNINDSLRAAARYDDTSVPASVRESQANLDRIISEQPALKEDRVVYRNFSFMDPAKNPEIFTDGTRFTDAGFVSATDNSKLARDIHSAMGGTQVEIHIPEGAHILDMQQYRMYDEVLLPSGSTFDVTQTSDGRWVLNMVNPADISDITVERNALRTAAEKLRNDWIAGITNTEDQKLAESWQSLEFNDVNAYTRGAARAADVQLSNNVLAQSIDAASKNLVEVGVETNPLGEWPARMDEFIAQSGSASATEETYYRGMGARTIEDLHPGDLLSDPGFPFITKDPNIALDYGTGQVDQLAEIKLPAGMKTIPGDWTSLTEHIMPRDVQFVITDERTATITNIADGVPSQWDLPHTVRIVTMEPVLPAAAPEAAAETAPVADYRFVGNTDEMVKWQADNAVSPTVAQTQTLSDYQSGEIGDMNTMLRGGVADSPYQDVVNTMDSLMKPLNSDITVYRGVGTGDVPLKVGAVFQDNGFVATSLAGEIPAEATNGVIMKIEVPAGANALVIPDSIDGMQMQEVVLPHGSKFEVVRLQEVQGGVIQVDARFVSAPEITITSSPVDAAPAVAPDAVSVAEPSGSVDDAMQRYIDQRRAEREAEAAAPASVNAQPIEDPAAYLREAARTENFAPDQHLAVSRYTSSDGEEINSHLRGTGDEYTAKHAAQLQADALQMDAAIANGSTFTEPTVLYRGGVTTQHVVGDIIQDHGFMSTSLDEATAETFTDEALWEIHVPQGQHFITGVLHEYEAILPRDTQLQIVSRTRMEGGGWRYVADVVPSEPVSVAATTATTDYTSWTSQQLREELQRRGLPYSYLKPGLIQRLQESDIANAAKTYMMEVNT